jgi:phosphatidate cytidylyltransferase
MNELSKRVLTALALLLLVWAWYFYAPPLWFNRILAFVAWVATCELVLLVKLRQPVIYMLAALPAWVLFSISPDFLQPLLLAFVWFALFVLFSRHKQPCFADLFAAIWLLCWLFVFAFVVLQTHGSETGQALIIGVCLAVWTADTAAYFVGRSWGKRKLCPAISPGKSIEGLLGGLLFAVPVAVLCWLQWGVLSLPAAVVLAIICVLAGVLGDLSESAVKRTVGAKDSGHWLPGHGGILDRIDAIIMAVPVTWAVWSTM